MTRFDRLNRGDMSHVYISDLTGHGLERITEEKIFLIDYSIDSKASKIFLLAQNIPDDSGLPLEHWEEQLYVYDIEAGTLSSPLRGHRYISRARELIWQ